MLVYMLQERMQESLIEMYYICHELLKYYNHVVSTSSCT